MPLRDGEVQGPGHFLRLLFTNVVCLNADSPRLEGPHLCSPHGNAFPGSWDHWGRGITGAVGCSGTSSLLTKSDAASLGPVPGMLAGSGPLLKLGA